MAAHRVRGNIMIVFCLSYCGNERVCDAKGQLYEYVTFYCIKLCKKKNASIAITL